MISPEHVKLMRRIVIFVLSAAVSTLIGIYIKGLVTQEAEITLDVWVVEKKATDQSDAIKAIPPLSPFPVTEQRIYISNTGELPLDDFTVRVTRRVIAPQLASMIGFGTPVLVNVGPGADCQVLENDRRSITWKCPLINPRERVNLTILRTIGQHATLSIYVRGRGFNDVRIDEKVRHEW